MTWRDLRAGWFRLAHLWQRRRHERELAEELEFHLAMKIRAGRSAEEARREFGGFEKWKEACRDAGRWQIPEEFARDLILALRLLRKSPLFTAVALVTLMLAIGANTALFSLLNELMLKSVPVPHAKRLAILRIQPDPFGYTFSYPLFQMLEQHSNSVMRVFAFADRSFELHSRDGVEAVSGQFVSGRYFAALGLRPQLGRWIEPYDDRPGGPEGMVAVVSHHFWRTRLGSDRHAIGRKINLNHGNFTVIGIMPQGFRGMSRDRAPDVFIPLQLEPFVDSPFNLLAFGYRAWWLSVGGYLKEGVSPEQASAFLRTKSSLFFEPAASSMNFRLNGHTIKELHLIAEPGVSGLSYLRLRFRQPLTVLMGLVTTVLLVACLNLAALLSARAASRSREVATRFALGASRARLLRQLLTESLVLAVAGAVLGLAAAPALARFPATMLTPQHGPQSAGFEVSPDLTVFLFTALLTILATVLAGALPAVRSTGEEVQGAVRNSSNLMRGTERRPWWPRVFLALQVGLSLVLVTGASLLGYSLVRLHQTPLGFEPQGLIYLFTEGRPPLQGERLLSTYRQILNEIRSLPEVEEASISAAVPIHGRYIEENLQAVGGSKLHIQENAVGPDYFKTLRTPLLSGREFRWTDTAASGRKVILNRSAVRLLSPSSNVLGHHIILEDGKTQAEIIGVVEDSKYSNLREPAPPTAYFAAMQSLIPGASLSLLVRAKGPAKPAIAAAGQVVRRALPDVPAPTAMSMEETIAESLVTERVMATLALFFGGLALLITGVGLYGTLAYSTERRTGEIGIRLALGAQPREIIAMVCAENSSIVVLGGLAGMAGSVFVSRTIASFLYGISAHDPVVWAVSAAMLLSVATAASLAPAAKAARTDPLTAIRHQ
jgi:predicted permease